MPEHRGTSVKLNEIKGPFLRSIVKAAFFMLGNAYHGEASFYSVLIKVISKLRAFPRHSTQLHMQFFLLLQSSADSSLVTAYQTILGFSVYQLPSYRYQRGR